MQHTKEALSPYDIERFYGNEHLASLICPACKIQNEKQLRFKTAYRQRKSSEKLSVYWCPACTSFFFYPLTVANYDKDLPSKFTDWYIELTAGIDCMFGILSRIPKSKGRRLLEIGSGYGFFLDLWEFQMNAPAWGIEPSGYGDRGKKELKANIQKTLLTEGMDPAGDGGKFSVVTSMEVIEHVEDVEGFVRMAASYLEEDGLLILTTPNTVLLEEKSSEDHEIWQTLSPIFHTVILSPQAFKAVLEKAGFKYQKSFNTKQQQVIYACREPFELEKTTMDSDMKGYMNYLQELKKKAEPRTTLLFGASYRLLEAQVNMGHFCEAVRTQIEFERELQKCYRFYAKPVEEATQAALSIWSDWKFKRQFPFYALSLQYLRGMTALVYKQDEDLAIQHFESAIKLAPRLLKVYPSLTFSVLPLLDRMRCEAAKIKARMSGMKRKEGLKELKRMRKANNVILPFWKEKASIERLKALIDYSRYREATEEILWLEEWWLSGDLPLGDVFRNPTVDKLEGDSERLSHYLCYLNARGQIANFLQENPQYQIESRGVEDAYLSYYTLVKMALPLLESVKDREFAMMLLPGACYALGHLHVFKKRRLEAHACWRKMVDLIDRYGNKSHFHWKDAALLALQRIPEMEPETLPVHHEVSSVKMQGTIQESIGTIPIEKDFDLIERWQTWVHSTEEVHLQIEQTWCDDGHVGMRGFVLAADGNPQGVNLKFQGRDPESIHWMERPDVSKHFPHMPLQLRCGFTVSFRRRAGHELRMTTASGKAFELTFSATGYPLRTSNVELPLRFEEFVDHVNQQGSSVLEIGSRLVSPGAVSYRKSFKDHVVYTGFDYHPDANTDVVGDAHRLSSYFSEGKKFDAIFSNVVLEHVTYPWQVALEINKMLPIGGVTYHCVPFTVPLHEMPWDFWRFTHQGLKSLFSPATGFECIKANLEMPCYVHPSPLSAPEIQTPMIESWMSACIFARKVADVDVDRFRWDAGALDAMPNEGVYPFRKSSNA